MPTYYHLHENGKGVELGFLCIGKNFDEADEVASMLVASGKTRNSLWILDADGVQALLSSISKQCPYMRPITVEIKTDGKRKPHSNRKR